MPCVLCGHSAPTNRNVIISQPCVNSKNGSAFSLLSFFQPCGFHSIHSLVSIQRKIQKGRSGSPGLSLCAFPLFLVLGPPILVALASPQSDLLCDLLSSPQWGCCTLSGLPFPALRSGNCLQVVTGVIAGSAHLLGFPSLLEFCFAFCPKSANSVFTFCFICFLVVYIKGAIPVAVNTSWAVQKFCLTCLRHLLLLFFK